MVKHLVPPAFVNSKFQIAGFLWALCRIPLGFVSNSPGVFRTNAGQRSGKPQGIRWQMRRLFTRITAPNVAGGRSAGSDRRDCYQCWLFL